MKKISLYLLLLAATCAAPRTLQAWPTWFPAWFTNAQNSECTECTECAECALCVEEYVHAHQDVTTVEKKSQSSLCEKTLLGEVKYLADRSALLVGRGALAVSYTVASILSIPAVRTVIEKIGTQTADIRQKIQAFRSRYPNIWNTALVGAGAGMVGGMMPQYLGDDTLSTQLIKDVSQGALIGAAVNFAYNIALNSTYDIEETDDRHFLASSLISFLAAAKALASTKQTGESTVPRPNII